MTKTITQIRAEAPAGPLTGAELVEITQEGATKGGSYSELKAWAISEVQAAILALQNASAPTPTGTLLSSGGGVAWAGDFDLIVSAASFLIQGEAHTSAQTTLTPAAADAEDPRIDVIAATADDEVVIIAGTPDPNPVKPDLDPLTQLELTFVYVPAGATELVATITADLYHENAEWTTSRSGTTIELASATAPHAGAVSLNGTAVTTGNWVQFAAPAPLDLAESDSLIFWILSKAQWPATRSMSLQWRSGNTTPRGSVVTFKHGSFGFDSSITGAYQQIVIPLALFGANGLSVDRLRLTCAGSGATIGFYADDFVLQGGLNATPTLANDRLRDRGAWVATSAYEANDLVTHSRMVAVAKAASTNSEPTASNPNWRLLVDFSDVALKSQGNAFTGQQYSAAVPLGLTLSGAVELDALDGNVFEGTVTGNITELSIVNGAAGMTFSLRLTIGGAGGWSIAYDESIHFPGGEPVFPEDPDDVIVISGQYHASNATWECSAVAPGSGGGGGSSAAEDITIVDVGAHYAGTNVEAALQEVPALVSAAVSAVVAAAPGTLDTLNELAAALGDDANYAATVTAALADLQDQIDALDAGGGGSTGVHDVPLMAGAWTPRSNGTGCGAGMVDTGAGTPEWYGLSFDQTTQQYATAPLILPKSYDGGTITARILFVRETGAGTGVRWSLRATSASDGDAANVAFGTAAEVTKTAASTNTFYTTASFGPITIGNTPGDYDSIHLELSRLPAHADDDMSARAIVLGVILHVTLDASNDA